MNLSQIEKFKWEKGGEWFEKWYSTEQCFIAFYLNPLTESFWPQGLNVIALNTQWYYEVEKSEAWEVVQKEVIKNGLNFYKNLIKEDKELIQEAEICLKKLGNLDQVDITTFKQIRETLLKLWHVFLADIGKYLDDRIEVLLKDENLTREQIEQIKNYYLTSHKPLAYHEEQESLANIYNFFSSKFSDLSEIRLGQLPEDGVSLLKNHKAKFEWLSTSDIDTDPPTIEDYLNRVKSMRIMDNSHQKNKLEEDVKKLIPDYKRLLLESLNELLYIDNYTADIYQKIDFMFQKLLSKVRKIPFKDISWYSWSDLEALIQDGLKLNEEELVTRKNFRVMIQIDGEITMLYGEKNYRKVKTLLGVRDLKMVKSFKGIKASLGYAQGVAKIIRGIKDMDKVKNGDIVVANTTRPDLMPALRKCAGIITDHGGVTSHAAIVSRELKIPCVVGTEIATEVIKDGNLIEVDANKGEVRILK